MCAAINRVDPIWTRYVKGLTRWDYGEISIDQARAINPAWADLVEHLNRPLVQRPRRWQVEGATDVICGEFS
ncbi:hypothetical protein R3Q08_31010 [Rhodococcus erythropolis]|uniref:hypothetical protein n=1 Tax=Rhodococcus erythropolis TaxID=1833 RepID=UPI00294A3F85|nr:hypothetical protein [Rhodococcus erythropolis]MDV6212694.1 hypothetical protein [Rhodococcus erythropolis]